MIRKFWGIIFVFGLLIAFPFPNLFAKEDTAQITLRKTAISKENTYIYIVKKGDILSTIVRYIPGIRDEDLADNYRLIQELNPDIEDVNKLRVGQKLILPGRLSAQTGQEMVAPTPDMQRRIELPHAFPPASSSVYLIKSGDTLYRIIVRELKDTSDIKGTMNQIKSMNPQIKNINLIYAGDTIKLPAQDYVAVAARSPFADEEDKLIEKGADRQETTGDKEITSMPPEVRLAVIKHVLSQMNASVTSAGNYYLPIPKTGQITIDCSKMPVIEFDNGTTMFLDLEGRTPDNLKRIISDNWSNFILVKVGQKDNAIVVLRKIFGSLKTYTMVKQSKPITIGSGLTAEFFCRLDNFAHRCHAVSSYISGTAYPLRRQSAFPQIPEKLCPSQRPDHHGNLRGKRHCGKTGGNIFPAADDKLSHQLSKGFCPCSFDQLRNRRRERRGY